MGRTLVGVAALVGAIIMTGAESPVRGQGQKQVGSAAKVERTYTGCVRRMLGEINFRLVDAVDVKVAGKPTALRLIMPKGKESSLFDYIGHRVEVAGIVGDPLPVNNAMDDVNHLAITKIKSIAARCR